eukprot:tig00000441_g713.t1
MMGPGGWAFVPHFQLNPAAGNGEPHGRDLASPAGGGRSGPSKQPAAPAPASQIITQLPSASLITQLKQQQPPVNGPKEQAPAGVEAASSPPARPPAPGHAQGQLLGQQGLPLDFRQELAAQLHFHQQQLQLQQQELQRAHAQQAGAHPRGHAPPHSSSRPAPSQPAAAALPCPSAGPLVFDLPVCPSMAMAGAPSFAQMIGDLGLSWAPRPGPPGTFASTHAGPAPEPARHAAEAPPGAGRRATGEEAGRAGAEEGALGAGEGRPSAGWTGEEPRKLLARMRRHFKVPSEEAVRALGLSGTTMKRVCRKCGIKRWPFRKFDSLRRWAAVVRGLAHLQQTEQCAPIAGFSEEHYLSLIEGRSQQIMEDPNTSIEDLVCQLRKELFRRALGAAGSDAPSSASKAAGRESQRRIAKIFADAGIKAD